MSKSEKQFKATLKAMIFAQSLVEEMDTIELNPAYKHQFKQKGKRFIGEVDKFLNAAYGDMTENERNMVEIMELCQKAIDKIFDEHMEIT